MEALLFVVTILALIGAYLNSTGVVYGFHLWLFTNAVFAHHNFMIAEYSQMSLFLAYFLIALNGIKNAK